MVYLRPATELHESVDHISFLLMSVDWCAFEQVLPVLDPFMHIHKKFETNAVTDSLVVPLVAVLCLALNDEPAALEDTPPSAPQELAEAPATLLLCVRALVPNFGNRWGDGSDIMSYEEGLRQQLEGFLEEQVMATTLDRRCKVLYGVPKVEHAGCLRRDGVSRKGRCRGRADVKVGVSFGVKVADPSRFWTNAKRQRRGP